MSYAEQLRHPRWQQKRLEVFNHYGWTCFRCGGKDRELHAHHKQYLKGHKPWEYPLENFESLCDKCHEMVHVQKAALEGVLATFPSTEYRRLMRILETTKRLGDAASDPITRANIVQDEIDLEIDYLRGTGITGDVE
jgi:hypothetical protein